MAQDTLLGFPAHALPYRRGEFTTLSTVSKPRSFRSGAFPNGSSLFQQGHINIRGLIDVHAVGSVGGLEGNGGIRPRDRCDGVVV